MRYCGVIDLNADVGEGMGDDAALMPFLTSANIACGGHAGDEATMRATAGLARRHGVVIGAHPGFVDRAGFGRRETPVEAGEVRRLVAEQVAKLAAWADVRYVKPHGALYHLANREEAVAAEVVEAVVAQDPRLGVLGLGGGALARAARRARVRFVAEGFADRRYAVDGGLVARHEPDALIETTAEVAEQVLAMVRESQVRTRDGRRVEVRVESVCLHGDTPGAAALARELRRTLAEAGVAVRAFA